MGLLAVLPFSSAPAQEPAPGANAPAEEASDRDRQEIEALVRSFMKAPSFPDWRERYTGDMRLYGSRPTPGASYYDDKYELEIRVNDRDETSAVVATTVADPKTRQQSDFYLFLRKEEGQWKLAAVRTFAPPRGTGQMYAALAAKGKDVSAADMRELSLMRVLQFNDFGLKESFKERRKRLDEIAGTVSKRGIDEIIHGSTRHSRVDEELWQQVHDAGLNFVELRESGVVDLNAASFGEAAVGYFYVPEGATVPKATPDDYVLVEPLDDRWYLYRKQ